jgi:hypothetical protein
MVTMDHIEITVLLLSHACMLRALPSNGRCLLSYCLAAGLYAIITCAMLKGKSYRGERNGVPLSHCDVTQSRVLTGFFVFEILLNVKLEILLPPKATDMKLCIELDVF